MSDLYILNLALLVFIIIAVPVLYYSQKCVKKAEQKVKEAEDDLANFLRWRMAFNTREIEQKTQISFQRRIANIIEQLPPSPDSIQLAHWCDNKGTRFLNFLQQDLVFVSQCCSTNTYSYDWPKADGIISTEEMKTIDSFLINGVNMSLLQEAK